MPQIPISNPSQRIDPASPVAIGSGEGARAMGEATSGLGRELFTLGNMLDQAGKKAKEEEDKLSVTRAINAARLEMLKERARQEAAGIQKEDEASGVSGVNRFNEKINPILNTIAGTLDTPKKRDMFYAGIGDDVVRDSSVVLATEVGKREKNLGVMMQENINDKASLARQDYGKTSTSINELELEIMMSNYLPDAQKQILFEKGRKQIAGEALNGFVDAGGNGDQSAWNKARNALTQDFKHIFSNEEMDKQMAAIDAAENGYYTRTWQAQVQMEHNEDRAAKALQNKLTTKYTSAIAAAGNNQFELGIVHRQIELDPTLNPEAKKRLTDMRTFMETKDDTYEGNTFTKVLKGEAITKTMESVNTDFLNGKVSADRRDKILKALQNMQEFKQKDPTIMAAVSQFRDEINNYKKPPTWDPVAGMYRQENDTYNEKVQSDFTMRVARLSAEGRLSANNVESAFHATMKNSNYGGRSVKKDVKGVNPEHLTTTKGTQDVIDGLYKDYKINGSTWSPEKKAQVREQLRGLQENKAATQQRDSMKLSPIMQPSKDKVFDE